jgi:hypothetical protein
MLGSDRIEARTRHRRFHHVIIRRIGAAATPRAVGA